MNVCLSVHVFTPPKPPQQRPGSGRHYLTMLTMKVESWMCKYLVPRQLLMEEATSLTGMDWMELLLLLLQVPYAKAAVVVSGRGGGEREGGSKATPPLLQVQVAGREKSTHG